MFISTLRSAKFLPVDYLLSNHNPQLIQTKYLRETLPDKNNTPIPVT